MPYINEDDINKVREASDLVEVASAYVNLQQKGRDFWAVCPFHADKNPSMKIDPALQLWHCFGCNKGGDVFAFIKEAEHLDFVDAVLHLAKRANIDVHFAGKAGVAHDKKSRLIAVCEEAAKFYHMQLMRSKDKGAQEARDYLHKRGFGSEISKKWMLGFAPGRRSLLKHLKANGFNTSEIIEANLAVERSRGNTNDRFFNRVMFPVRDIRENTIAFGGRVMDKSQPKYLNSSETPIFHKSNNLFGIDKAKSHIVTSRHAVIVEGYTDVIALHEANIQCAVATLGTALTSQHLKLLSRYTSKIIYLFDGDEAGQKAADRAASFIDWHSAIESQRDPLELDVVILPANLDPAEFIAAHGPDELKKLLEDAKPLLKFAIMRRLNSFDVSVPEQKVRAMNSALEVLYPLKGSISATDYINLIADTLNIGYNDVFETFKKMRAPMAARHHNNIATHQSQKQVVGSTSAGVNAGGGNAAGTAFAGAAGSAGGSNAGAAGANAASAAGVTGTVNTAGAVGTGAAFPADSASARIINADRRFARMEYELLGLIVQDASLLQSVANDLMQIAWSNPDAKKMAEALVKMSPSSSPAQCFSALQLVCSNTAAHLSEAMSDTSFGAGTSSAGNASGAGVNRSGAGKAGSAGNTGGASASIGGAADGGEHHGTASGTNGAKSSSTASRANADFASVSYHADAMRRVSILLFTLKARDLERNIRAGKAQLKELGKDSAKADELFERIVKLQKDLAALRKEAGIGKSIDER